MADAPKQIRLNKEDHRNIVKVKKQMKALNFPEASITLSSAIRFALAKVAKGE